MRRTPLYQFLLLEIVGAFSSVGWADMLLAEAVLRRFRDRWLRLLAADHDRRSTNIQSRTVPACSL